MAIVLRPVPKSARRRPKSATQRAPRYHRRNPEVLGTPLEDAAAVAGGIYATQQVAGLMSTVATPVTSPINGIRPGLGNAALSAVSAFVAGRLIGLWKRQYGNKAQLGGMALAASQAVTAFAPGISPLAGTPVLTSGIKFPSLAAPKAEEKAAVPALPSVSSQL